MLSVGPMLRHEAMVAIAQLVERLVVVQEVAGSSPVSHPSTKAPHRWCGAFVVHRAARRRPTGGVAPQARFAIASAKFASVGFDPL